MINRWLSAFHFFPKIRRNYFKNFKTSGIFSKCAYLSTLCSPWWHFKKCLMYFVVCFQILLPSIYSWKFLPRILPVAFELKITIWWNHTERFSSYRSEPSRGLLHDLIAKCFQAEIQQLTLNWKSCSKLLWLVKQECPLSMMNSGSTTWAQ